MAHPYPVEEHDARVMCADPQALAYAWMTGYLDNLNSRIGSDDGHDITMDELIQTAMSHLDENSRWGGDYITRGGAFEGEGTDPTFWEKLAIFKGIDIPEEKRGNFFSCSC
jgi:hypothetical protein